MEFESGYILSLIVVGLGFLCCVLAMMVSEINRKKGAIIYILSFILFALGVYYYYTVGQEQKTAGGNSANQLNYYLHVYRAQPAPSVPLQVQPGPLQVSPRLPAVHPLK